MELLVFKATDALWILHDAGKLISCSPPGGSGPGYVGFIALEEATIFLADSSWDKGLLATKLGLDHLWAVETLPVYVLTPVGHQGNVAIQTLTKEAICGK